MPAPEITTFGCRLNIFESEIMLGHAKSAGLQNTYIVNTCSVTAEAERQALQAIRKLRREHPQGTIIVSGCAAQINPELFSDMPEVDRVLGNEEKLNVDSYSITPTENPIQVTDIMKVKEIAGHLISGFESHTRAFVQIQQGCDHRCTFCIIPFGRGNSRSIPLGFLVNQIRQLVELGYREVVLTGVDISSYGKDLPGSPSLGQMCARLMLQVPELERLRLSSLDPGVIDDDLIKLIANEPRLMPHIHLSIQSGSNIILKRMKRRHTREGAIDLSSKIRAVRPNVVFGADIIAGFPTETDKDFQDTLNLLDDANLTFLHVFPFSIREKTPAARMPQIPKDVRKERSARLREKGKTNKNLFFDSLIGSTASVLNESGRRGYTEHYAPVELGSALDPGHIVTVRITGRSKSVLLAEKL